MESKTEKQMSFDFEGDAPETPANKPESDKATPETRASHLKIEINDECQYCGQEYDSKQSCPYCMNNPIKKSALRDKGK